MKRELGGRHFDSDDDVIAAVDHFPWVHDADFYKEGGGIYMLHYQRTKFVNIEGDILIMNVICFLKLPPYQTPLNILPKTMDEVHLCEI